MLRAHRDLILNWFRAQGQFSSSTVEGFNGKARVITKGHADFALSGDGSRSVSCTWRFAGASTYPQILLTRPMSLGAITATD